VRIAGVPLRIRPSFVALGLLAAFSVAPSLRDDVPHLSDVAAGVLGSLVAIGLLLSVLLHEVAHAVVGRQLGMPVEGVELSLLGGATSLGGKPATARDQYLVSVSGPVVNVLLAGVFGVVAGLTARNTAVNVMAALLCVVNTLLALYNLLPGLPLDGGQIVRAAVWRVTGDKTKGLRAAGLGGMITAGATFLVGYAEIAHRETGGGLITIGVAAFIGVQAQGAFAGAGLAQRLPGVIAGRLARPAYLAPSDLPLAEALRRAAAIGRSAVVLGTDGRPSAVLSDALLAAVPDPRRPWVSLSSVSRPVPETAYLDADLTGEALIEAMGTDKAAEYVVMHDGHLVGVLRASDVAQQLRGRPA
jgi:Zn-dependent protease